MAIQDNFIGNLRAARDIARGTAPITKSAKKTEPPKNVPGNIDQPTTDLGKWRDNHAAANRGSLFEKAWNNPEENIAPGAGAIRPLTFNDVQAVMPYKPLFEQAISEYTSEPNGDERIKILDKYGTDTVLGTLPGVASYLRILRDTEDAVRRSNTTNYNYAETADSMRKRLDAEINKFYLRT